MKHLNFMVGLMVWFAIGCDSVCPSGTMEAGRLCVRKSKTENADGLNTPDAGAHVRDCPRCPAGAQCKASDCDSVLSPRSPNAVMPSSAAVRASSANYVLQISLGMPSGTAASKNYKLLLGAETTAMRKANEP